jgi:uncharacterized protein (DUF934 family)
MPLLKNNEFVSDIWTTLNDDQALPEGGNVIVSFARLSQDWDQLAKFTGLVGARLTNTDTSDSLHPFMQHLAIIVLPFPAFADGRAYSIARSLRLDGFRGELRATGNVLPDQLQLMRQVGFDTFDVSERFGLDVWQKASHQMSLAYQRGLFRPAGEVEVWTKRHGDYAPWEEQSHAG